MRGRVPGLKKLITAARARCERFAQRYLHVDPVTHRRILRRRDLRRFGSAYGGWVVPTRLLSDQAVCYCAGVGTDATFDLEIIRRFGCRVVALDPTPRAREYVERLGPVDGFTFLPVGLWDREETLRFYAPADPTHVSHSIVNLQRTESFFEAPCKRLSNLMHERGDEGVDLVKLDIEGAEYRVLTSIIEDKIPVRVLCVEFDELHHPLDRGYRRRIARAVGDLESAGFELVSIADGANYTFVRE